MTPQINFQKQIKKRMAELDIPSGYALAKLVGHKITTLAIDNFLAGRSQMTAANLELILDALDAELKFKKGKRRPRQKSSG